MNNFKVYSRYNTLTNKYYIGITSKTLDERSGIDGKKYLMVNNKGNYKHPKLAAAIIKYGWSAFTSEVLHEGLSLENAKDLEKKLIIEYDSYNNGYNSSPGGDYIYDSSKPVIMINPKDNEELFIFESASNAAAFVGIKNNTNITRCCKGTQRTAGKYNNLPVTWRYLNETESDLILRESNSALQDIKFNNRKRMLETHMKRKTKMFYLDDIDNTIMEFESAIEGANFIGLKSYNGIYQCCNGYRNYAGTFNNKKVTWRYSEMTVDELSEFKNRCQERSRKSAERYKHISRMKPHMKSIIGTSIKDGMIVEFNSLKDAAKYCGLKNLTSISNTLKGRQRSAGGYYWRYNERD